VRSIVEHFLSNSSGVCWNTVYCWNLFQRWKRSHRSSHPPKKSREKGVRRVKITVSEQSMPCAAVNKGV
jgi:hypothetical protein